MILQLNIAELEAELEVLLNQAAPKVDELDPEIAT
jgi:hypothetical protein